MPKTGMRGVPFNNDFEEIKKSIRAQNNTTQSACFNNFLLEKHSINELIEYAKAVNKRYNSNDFLAPARIKRHFKWLADCGWIIEGKEDYYQIVGHKDAESTSHTLSGQHQVKKQKGEGYTPTKEDCEKAIERLKHSKSKSFVSENEVLNFLETQFKDNCPLHNNWREITKKTLKAGFYKLSRLIAKPKQLVMFMSMSVSAI